MSKAVVSSHETNNSSTRQYVIGFGLSLILTIAAYILVTQRVFSGWMLLWALSVLAVIQLCVQLIFFLHLTQERRPHWNLQALLFAAGVVVIIVFGSLWIMKNLDYAHHQVSPQEIIKDEGYKQ